MESSLIDSAPINKDNSDTEEVLVADVPHALVCRTRWICFIATFIFYIPMYAFLPAITEYFINRRCEVLNGGDHCDDDTVNASAADWMNWTFVLPVNIPNAITALALGTLSDRYGRRPLLILCVVSQCVGSLVSLAVVLFKLNLWWMVPGFIINGLGGASWVFVVLIMAALGDTAKDEKDRTWVFGAIMGMIYFTTAAGPLLGGEITRSAGRIFNGDCSWCHGADYQTVFLIFAVSNIILVFVIVLGLKETVQVALMKENRTRARRAISSGSSVWMVHFVRPTFSPLRIVLYSRQLLIMTVIYSFCYLGMADRSGLITLYAKKEPFKMDPTTLGWFLASIGTVRSVSVFVVFPVAFHIMTKLYMHRGYPKLEASRRALVQTMKTGILFAVIFTSALALAHNVPVLFAIASVEGVDAIWDTSLRVLFTSVGPSVGAGEGEILGLIGFLQVFLGSIAPLLFQTIYARTVHWCAPFSFYLIAALTAVGYLFSFLLKFPHLASPTRREVEKTPLLH